MTREEYEGRKLQIEAEHRAAMELIAAARQAQLRALEMVWLAGGDGAAAGAAAFPPLPGLAAGEAPRPAIAVVPAPAPPARPPRLAIHQLWDDVVGAIAALPDTFDTKDVLRTLGYSPHRGSLHRVLHEIREEGEIEIVQFATGREANRYRKLPRRQTGTGGELDATAS